MGTKFRKDVENSLKRFLKGKAKITLGFVVAFLITGSAVYAGNDDPAPNVHHNSMIKLDYEFQIFARDNGPVQIFYFDKGISITNKDESHLYAGVVVGSDTSTVNATFNIGKSDTPIIVDGKKYDVYLQGADRALMIKNGSSLTINGEGTNLYFSSLGKDIVSGGHTISIGDEGEGSDFSIKANSMITTGGAESNLFLSDNSTAVISLEDDFVSKNGGIGIMMVNGYANNSTTSLQLEAKNINLSTVEKENENGTGALVGLYMQGEKNADDELSANLTARENINISGAKNGIEIWRGAKVELSAADKITISGKNLAIASLDEKSSVVLEKGNFAEITGGIYARNTGEIDIKTLQNIITGDILAKGSGAVTIENSLNDVTGNILAETNGKVSLDLTDGKLTGKVNDSRLGNTTSGTVKLNLDNGTWESIGKGSVTEVNLNNSGNIKFTDNASSVDIQNLTGKGNGTFAMTVNSDNKSEGNMIYVQNSEGGTYQIDLQNSDLSKIKVGDKIRFATIGEDAKNNNLEFTVLDVKERGIRDVSFTVGYEDFEKGNTENGTYNDGTNKSGNEYVETNYENGENWYLTREENSVPAPNPDPDTDKPTTDPDESINDIGISIIEMARANYSSAVYMDNLNKRLGDMSFVEGNSGLWVRMRNDRVGEDKEYRLHNNMAQIGYDKMYNLENGKEHRGIAFDYADGQMEYKNLKGESDIDRYTVSLYDTRVYNSGVYADYTARAGYMTSDFEVYGRETGNQVKGDYDNLVLGVGAEFGKRYNFGETSYFEPQIQLQYTYIDDTDYTTNQDTKVNYDEIHSLIGRAGIRVGHDFYRENSKDNTVYLKFDMNHEFLGDQDVKASDVTGTLNKTYNNDNTWYDIGIGGAKNLTENLYVYADMERQFGEERDNSWQFNLGFRYKFGSLKDFAFNTANLFDFDKSEVKPAGKEMIKNASEIINKKNIKGTLLIEGHTDWTGSEEYNQLLSEKRARAVQEAFEENVTNENIKYETKGYGETKPKADNRTSEGRAENRRVEINYVK